MTAIDKVKQNLSRLLIAFDLKDMSFNVHARENNKFALQFSGSKGSLDKFSDLRFVKAFMEKESDDTYIYQLDEDKMSKIKITEEREDAGIN